MKLKELCDKFILMAAESSKKFDCHTSIDIRFDNSSNGYTTTIIKYYIANPPGNLKTFHELKTVKEVFDYHKEIMETNYAS